MLNVTIVVGNPKARSRTRHVAERTVANLLAPGSYAATTIDLADHAKWMFDWPSERMATLNEQAASSDLLVVASPTYKSTYTGLLKAFLDRYPNLGLRGVVAIPVMTGADLRHAMGPEVNLRPLLVELGAIVPTRALYFVTEHMDRLDELTTGWVRENRAWLAPHLRDVLDRAPAASEGRG